LLLAHLFVKVPPQETAKGPFRFLNELPPVAYNTCLSYHTKVEASRSVPLPWTQQANLPV